MLKFSPNPLFRNSLSIMGAAVLALGSLHALTEIYVRVKYHFFSTKLPLCVPVSNFSSASSKTSLPPPKVIITGGFQGLGLQLVRRFVQLGYHVQIWDLPEEIEDESKQKKFFAESGFSESSPSSSLELVAVDVSSVEQIETACGNYLHSNNGNGPDLLVLNAGVVARKAIGEFQPGEIQKCFATNVSVHAFELLNILLPKMLVSPPTSSSSSSTSISSPPWKRAIVLISSVTSFSGFAFASEYCATKAALVSLGDSLRSEIRLKGASLDVVTVCPYLISTRMFDWCRPPFWFFSPMSAEWVAERIVNDGIRFGRTCLVLPWFFNLMPIVKWSVPDWCWLIADDLVEASSWLKPPV
jgi:NAD(P)-dependent dehydrogenase (short-subunit alcohol dehydrogenase family)